MAPKDFKDDVNRLTNSVKNSERSLKEILQNFVVINESGSDPSMPNALDNLKHNELCVIVVSSKHWVANWDAHDHCFILLVGSHPVEPNEVEEWWPLDWDSQETH